MICSQTLSVLAILPRSSGHGDPVMAPDVCLQCRESRETVKANGYICGIMSGGEYNELMHDWPKHRWADWTDTELKRPGISADHFHLYRRTNVDEFQFVDCTHRSQVHVYNETGDETLPPHGICLRCWADTRECAE